MTFSYSLPPIVPETYKCSTCGAQNCKLWREYQVMVGGPLALECCDCAGKSQEKDVSRIDAQGMRDDGYGKSDSIGWRVPAVPTLDGGWWGYTSVPQEGVAWWTALPTRASSPETRLQGSESAKA